MTGTAKLDMRKGPNGFGAFLIGNYAEAYVTPAPTFVPKFSYTPAGGTPVTAPAHTIPAAPASWQESTENLQGKLRYDRYLSTNFSVFTQVTGTHDAFQALTFRFNLDLGVKYLFIDRSATKLWFEVGYDFQFDDNYTDGSGIEQAGAGGPQLDATGVPYVIKPNDSIHSGRLFAGYLHSFNKEITLTAGLEYLQGFGGNGGAATQAPAGYFLVDSASEQTIENDTGMTPPINPIHNPSISTTGSRVNFNALLAAHLVGNVALGIGFQAKYNSAPLPGKVDLDTASTLTLIYAFGTAPPAPPPAAVPCVPAPPPPPPAPPPAPVAAAPVTSAPPVSPAVVVPVAAPAPATQPETAPHP
jgi:putative salt-induced outer membrane protein YdiY